MQTTPALGENFWKFDFMLFIAGIVNSITIYVD